MNLSHVESPISGEGFEKGSCLPFEGFAPSYRAWLQDGSVWVSIGKDGPNKVVIVRSGGNSRKVVALSTWERCYSLEPLTHRAK